MLTLRFYTGARFGDAIADARWLTALPPGADVTLAAQPALIDLFAFSFPSVNVVPRGNGPFPGWSNSRRIRVFATREPAWPYLSADPNPVEQYRAKVPSGAIGLCWQSRSAARSVQLADLEPVWRQFPTVSLQHGPGRDQITSTPIIDVLPTEPTFADVAAIIACCRRVVTVDTAVWHLAGAMGAEIHLIAAGAVGFYRYDLHPGVVVHALDGPHEGLAAALDQ